MASSTAPILSLSSQFYRVLLNVYPRPFREEYEHEMVIVFCDSLRAAQRSGNAFAIFYCWLTSLIDLATTAAHEWFAQKPGPIHYAQKIGIGLVAGLVGGVVAGVGARLAMRGVSLVAGLTPGFSLEGTFVILFIGAVMGTPFGIAYLAFRNLLPGTGVWKGLTFGLMLFVIFLAPPLLFYREGEFSLASPFVGLTLFAPLAFIYGLTTAYIVQRLERNIFPNTRATSQSPITWSALATQVFTILLFAVILEFAVLGVLSILNHFPGIPPAIIRMTRDTAIHFTALRDSNLWLISLTTLGYFGIASLIFWSRSRQPMARFTAVSLFLFGGAFFNTGAAYYLELVEPELLRPYFKFAQVIGTTALFALLLFFPKGRFNTKWSLPLGLIWLTYVSLWLTLPLTESITLGVLIPFFSAGLLAQLQYYQTTTPAERLQLHWPLIGFTIAIIGFACVTLAILIVPDLKLPKVDGLAVTATFGLYMLPWLFIPLTIGWAMRKHKLWQT